MIGGGALLLLLLLLLNDGNHRRLGFNPAVAVKPLGCLDSNTRRMRLMVFKRGELRRGKG